MQGKTSKKPVVKITVGGPRFWGRVFFTYLLTLPGVFQKLGTSEDPEKLRAGMQRTFKGALILTEARAFRDREKPWSMRAGFTQSIAATALSHPTDSPTRARRNSIHPERRFTYEA
jgi:hypothetical protein